MRGINLASYLENSVAAHPDKVALIFDNRKWTFTQVNEKANAIANGLTDMGIVMIGSRSFCPMFQSSSSGTSESSRPGPLSTR